MELTFQLSQMEQQRDKLQTHIDETAAHAGSVDAAASSSSSELVDNLRERISDMSAQLDEAHEASRESGAEQESLCRELAALREQHEQLQGEFASAQQEASEQLQVAAAHRESYTAEVTALKGRIVQLREERAALMERLGMPAAQAHSALNSPSGRKANLSFEQHFNSDADSAAAAGASGSADVLSLAAADALAELVPSSADIDLDVGDVRV